MVSGNRIKSVNGKCGLLHLKGSMSMSGIRQRLSVVLAETTAKTTGSNYSRYYD